MLVLACARFARAECGTSEDGFEPWLASFREEARGQGISAQTLALTLGSGVRYDEGVVALDRAQKPFKLGYAAFAAQRITRARIRTGKRLLEHHGELLAKIEKRFGVPRSILVAIWGLETDYGESIGTKSVFRSLATLAWDCRRAARFRGELTSALRIVERGDLKPSEMRGAWAGELGQTQFLPSSYERFATDFDGDGRADLLGSTADALASTANYLAGNGWRAGEGFTQGSENFRVLAAWNKSAIYQRTIAAFARKLGG